MNRYRHLLLAAVAVFVAHPAPAQQDDPAVRRIDLGGYAMALRCVGEGSPTVVIDGGAGTWSVHYRHLQDALAATTRTCAYDRAGFGESDPSPHARTSDHMATELHALLAAADEEGPFVLVGHSLGGYTVRVFADRHPERVAGIVLMEAAHEAQFERLPSQVSGAIGLAAGQLMGAAELARAGELPPPPLPWIPAFESHPELREAYARAQAEPELYETSAGEMEGAPESAKQAGNTRPLGDLPLVVVTAGNSFAPFGALGIPVPEANAVWLELQSELLDLSTDATQLLAPTATHQIDVDASELVLDAITSVVRAVRRGTRVAAAPGPSGEGARLRQSWVDYVAAINAESLDAVARFVSPGAILMPPNGPTVYGPEGARAWFGALFDAFEVEVEMPTLELLVLGDRAIRRGTFDISLAVPGGGPTRADRGKFLQVWERHADGRWRIVRGILNSDLPAPVVSDDRSGG